MLFNSYIFIFVFLPIMLIGYFWLLHKRLVLGSKIWLVAGSLFFYGYWNVIYIPLLLASILINFFTGSALSTMSLNNGKSINAKKNISDRITKKQLLLFGVLFNIGLLGYFKYTDFFLENFNGLFAANIPLPHIILPLGISFFTFTQIAFLVDAYKNEVKEYDLLRYMLFVTYFPHLLAGPILHHAEMMPQFANKWNFAVRWRNIAIGLFLFTIGLFKKVVIADTFAEWANAGFNTTVPLSFIEGWITSLSYTLQLYFDFSGYTDMAIGISLMFNIRLPINFNSPYKAKDIQDFWRRWHITLSRFLRDYIYIPLGGNKASKLRNYANLFTVFLIGGIWHGASWMFVIWGVLHGIAIVFHRIWKDLGFKMWSWLGWLITFNFINITWIFFRAENWEMAQNVFFPMITLHEVTFQSDFVKKIMLLVFVVLLLVWLKNSQQWAVKIKNNWVFRLIIGGMLGISIIMLNKISEFIYFNF